MCYERQLYLKMLRLYNLFNYQESFESQNAHERRYNLSMEKVKNEKAFDLETGLETLALDVSLKC